MSKEETVHKDHWELNADRLEEALKAALHATTKSASSSDVLQLLDALHDSQIRALLARDCWRVAPRGVDAVERATGPQRVRRNEISGVRATLRQRLNSSVGNAQRLL